MSTKILVVEDEPVIALDIRQRLVQLGYDIVAITDCAEAALDAVYHLQPELILMDIRLQGDQDGIETAMQIYLQYNIPTVFLTAHADAATIQQVKAVKPYGYIIKPFSTDELTTAIEVALSRHQADLAIQSALHKEKNLNELKTRFIAIVSHEFRNPLSSIMLSVDLLERHNGQAPVANQQRYLQRIRTAVDRMTELLEEVLVISQADVGMLSYHPVPIDLAHFCHQLLAEFQVGLDHTAPAKHTICFTASGVAADHRPLYHLDEKLLHHILTNLLSNAVKYSPNGGEITFDLIYGARWVSFRIQDQGIGIPADDLPRLFERFYRATNAATIPGTGLGLAIVKQYTEAHGGEITVASELNVGSTFMITLPSEPDTPPADAAPGANVDFGHNRTIGSASVDPSARLDTRGH